MPQTEPPFEITEDWPSSIVRDFDAFLEAVSAPSAYLTKAKQTLDRATLHALDGTVRTHRSGSGPRTDQEYYPLLNLFQNICIAGRLHNVGFRGEKLVMIPAEALAEFRKLTPSEKYVALLEATWVLCDWEDLFSKERAISSFGGDDTAKALVTYPVGTELRPFRRGPGITEPLSRGCDALLRLFSFFGVLRYTNDPQIESRYPYKGGVHVLTITLTEIGSRFLKVLSQERPYSRWNRPFILNGGDLFMDDDEDDADLDEDDGDEDAEAGEESKEEPADPVPFFKAFLPLVPLGSLKIGFPSAKVVAREGTYVFRVSLSPDVWRTIALSHEHTLEDLHLAIQDAYSFDDDHLYAFYMDRKSRTRNTYQDPRGGEGPFADEAVVGELQLYPRQVFRYLFDFGDNWEFDVELIEVREGKGERHPRILEKKGKSPKQYQ